MYANKPHQGISPRTRVLMIAVLAGALFTLAAKWAEKPIDSLVTVAGPWSGTGSHARGAEYTIKYWFKEDGSFKYGRIKKKDAKDVKKGPDALWIDAGKLWMEAGKLRWKSGKGPWTFTLYESKKGKRMLRGERPDGNTQQLKPAT